LSAVRSSADGSRSAVNDVGARLADGVFAVPAHAAIVIGERAMRVPARMRRFGTAAVALIVDL
jgi:hypothetical protein